MTLSEALLAVGFGWIVIGSFSIIWLFARTFLRYWKRTGRASFWNDGPLLISGGICLASVGIVISAAQRIWDAVVYGYSPEARDIAVQMLGTAVLVVAKILKTRGAAIQEDGSLGWEWTAFLIVAMIWGVLIALTAVI